MIPFGNQTVTLMHMGKNGYELHLLHGCSWRSAISRSTSLNTLEETHETTCRVPYTQTKPIPGDLLILGNIKAEAKNEIELVKLMESLQKQGINAFRAQQVKDNSIGCPLPHYAASGA